MVEITVKYEHEDLGLEDLLKRVARAQRSEVQVGFHDAHNAQKAAYNEFGTSSIPARPFMRQTFEQNRAKYEEGMKQAAADWLVGKTKTAGPGLRKNGRVLAKDIKATIRAGMSPANKEDKGAPGSLEDTGAMARAVKVVLE